MSRGVYRVGQSEIAIRFGDIAESRAEVLVSSDDGWLTLGGGVSRAILLKAGSGYWEETRKLAPAGAGEVVVSGAGLLPAKYVLHAITLAADQWDLPTGAVVRNAVGRVMALMPLLRCRSVAFPAIGAGVARIPYQEVASEMVSTLVMALLQSPEPYRVEVYLFDRFGEWSEEALLSLFEDYLTRTLGLLPEASNGVVHLAPPEPEAGESVSRRQEVFAMLQLLYAQRNELEGQLLVSTMGAMNPSPCSR